MAGNTGDGEEGLRQIADLIPDVVLLDTKMRKADGMDVCRRACSTSGGPKVAVLTSYRDPEELRLASQAGGTGYFLLNVAGLRQISIAHRPLHRISGHGRPIAVSFSDWIHARFTRRGALTRCRYCKISRCDWSTLVSWMGTERDWQ